MNLSLLRGAVVVATLACGAAAQGTALAAPAHPQGAVRTDVAFAPYFFGGRQYCWYESAWRGPGWYWCGSAWRNGLGWGGPRGWRGWREGGHGGDRHVFGGGANFGGGGHFGAGGGHFGRGGGHGGGGGHR
jgi:hypothetical protein